MPQIPLLSDQALGDLIDHYWVILDRFAVRIVIKKTKIAIAPVQTIDLIFEPYSWILFESNHSLAVRAISENTSSAEARVFLRIL